MAIQALKMKSTKSKLPADDRYITIKEFCGKYSMSRTRLYELMHMPGFPSVKIGRLVRIPENASHEWLMEQAERNTL
jgi:excisionase family DNA binding protein